MQSETIESKTETVKTTVAEGDTSVGASAGLSSLCGWDVGQMALWLIVLIFAIVWSIMVYCCWCKWSKSNKDCEDSCDRDSSSCNMGGLGAFLVWLIVLIIFIGVCYMWGFAGLAVFLVIAILLGFAMCVSCGSGKCKDECDTDGFGGKQQKGKN